MNELPKLVDIQSALTARDLRWTGNDVHSRLNTLYLAAWRILDLMPAPKDVFLQIFRRNDRQLPKLSVASHRPTYEQRLGRGWCLGIRLCVESGNVKQCARPFVDLASGSFAIDGLCLIHGLPSTHRGALDLVFSIEGSLHIPDRTVPGAPAGPDIIRESRVQGTMQQHNDAIREGILLTIARCTFATPTEILEAASTAIESVFRSSQLSKCVSLRGSSVVLQSGSRARIAVHKTYTETESSAHCLKICTAKANLSSDVEHRLGAKQIEVSIHHGHPSLENFYAGVAADLPVVLGRLLSTSSLRGIAAIEACVDDISARYPVLLPLRFAITFQIMGPKSALTTITLCRHSPETQDSWSLVLAVPVHSSYSILMDKDSAADLRIERIELFLRLPQRHRSLSYDSRELSLNERVMQVAEVIRTTLEQITDHVTFDDAAKVPTLLAQSVLETVRELTPGLELTGLSLTTRDWRVVVSSSTVAVTRKFSEMSLRQVRHQHQEQDPPGLKSKTMTGDGLGRIMDVPNSVTCSEPHYYLEQNASSVSTRAYRLRDAIEVWRSSELRPRFYNVVGRRGTDMTHVGSVSAANLIKGITLMPSLTASTLSSLCVELCHTTPLLQRIALGMTLDITSLSSEGLSKDYGCVNAQLTIKAVQGHQVGQLRFFIPFRRLFSTGLKGHADGTLQETSIIITLFSPSLLANSGPDITNASGEYLKTVYSIKQTLRPLVDGRVFEDAQSFADTVAQGAAKSPFLWATVPWSEVQATTRMYHPVTHVERPALVASAKRAISGQTTSHGAQEALQLRESGAAVSLAALGSLGCAAAGSDPADMAMVPDSPQSDAGTDFRERSARSRAEDGVSIHRTRPLDSDDMNASVQHHDGQVVGSAEELSDDTLHGVNSTVAQWKRGVVIALGSNIGDRIGEIEKACRAIDEDPDMRIVDTSCLYESEPMYVEDQDRFINGACEIETRLSPMDLLDRLQAIERGHGRVKLIEKGPRNIDLDILLFGDEVMSTERLTIPHALMHERAFVLRPLLDLRTMTNLQLPGIRNTPDRLLHGLDATMSSMDSVTPLLPDRMFVHRTKADRRTLVMSILNTTPDSFSDGGTHEATNVAHIKQVAAAHIAAGATIIDVGGQSSRPDAPDVTSEEEMSRVLPAIAAIRSLPEAQDIAISVDTYRAAVAKAAVAAGAHIINDISAGTLDPLMLKTVAKLGCTYIMMHMRGTPATMSSPEHCTYPDGLLAGVRAELQDRIDVAIATGIRKWRIIIDPGIGFAKTHEQNIDILRQLSLRQIWGTNTPDYNCGLGSRLSRFPMLLGSSRKGFIGSVTGVKDPKDRIMGTATTVATAVSAGADIVRVHDVAEMAQVAKMADAIYRVPRQKAQGKPWNPDVQLSSISGTKSAWGSLSRNRRKLTRQANLGRN
ncbi:trifunctional dihydropteroate synthetase [Oleoguttula sp. CCFEE 5521]